MLPTIRKNIKNIKVSILHFLMQLMQRLTPLMKRNKLVDIIVTECKLIYYAFYRGVKKCQKVNAYTHITKKTSAIGVYIMIIHATLIEKYRFSLFVSSMESSCSMGVTYFKRICNVYFLAEIQAMRKNPIIVTEEQVIIQIGLGKKIIIPFTQIDKITFYKGELLKKKESFLTQR